MFLQYIVPYIQCGCISAGCIHMFTLKVSCKLNCGCVLHGPSFLILMLVSVHLQLGGFGQAKSFDRTALDTMAGTFRWMAPEVCWLASYPDPIGRSAWESNKYIIQGSNIAIGY